VEKGRADLNKTGGAGRHGQDQTSDLQKARVRSRGKRGGRPGAAKCGLNEKKKRGDGSPRGRSVYESREKKMVEQGSEVDGGGTWREGRGGEGMRDMRTKTR